MHVYNPSILFISEHLLLPVAVQFLHSSAVGWNPIVAGGLQSHSEVDAIFVDHLMGDAGGHCWR